jgi:phage shock protein A
MGVLSRLATVIKAKMSQMISASEDPATMLDYSYEKQRDMLHQVKRGIVDVVTSRKRLELQADKLRANMNKLDQQSRDALAKGREDLARLAIQRKQAAAQQIEGLVGQISDLEAEQQRLQAAESKLAAKVEAFRSRKELTKAQYSAAEAQVRIGEAATGLSEEMASVGLAIERAEHKTEDMRARASAIDELVEAGTLDELGTPASDRLDRELAQMTAAQNVDSELAALKQQMGSPEARP